MTKVIYVDQVAKCGKHTQKNIEKNNFKIKITSAIDNHCQHLVYYVGYTFEHVHTQFTHRHIITCVLL